MPRSLSCMPQMKAFDFSARFPAILAKSMPLVSAGSRSRSPESFADVFCDFRYLGMLELEMCQIEIEIEESLALQSESESYSHRKKTNN